MTKQDSRKYSMHSDRKTRLGLTRLAAAAALVLLSFAASTAWAAVYVTSVNAPSAVSNPLDGFTVEFEMGGVNSGIGAAYVQVSFYLSARPDGSTGVAPLVTRGVHLTGGGSWGLWYPPSGTQTAYVSRGSLPANTLALLESITAACESETWYVLGWVFGTQIRSDETLLGSDKLPDFSFPAHSLSPTEIEPGGYTNLSFDVHTQCPASTESSVGIFLADASYQPLAFIGEVLVSAGAGTSTLPPTPITFSPFIPTGTYRIVLLADLWEIVDESNENNNIYNLDLYITADGLAAVSGAAEPELDAEVLEEVVSRFRDFKSGTFDAYVEGF